MQRCRNIILIEVGAALSIYSLAPLLGPGKTQSLFAPLSSPEPNILSAIGPIAGGWIAQKTTWRWIFWSTSAADALVQGLGLIFLQETYGPKLLKDRAKKQRKLTGNDRLKTEWDHPDQRLLAKLRHSTVRPFILLGTQPIVQVLALYMAYLYGIMCKASTFISLTRTVTEDLIDRSRARILLFAVDRQIPRISRYLRHQLHLRGPRMLSRSSIRRPGYEPHLHTSEA